MRLYANDTSYKNAKIYEELFLFFLTCVHTRRMMVYGVRVLQVHQNHTDLQPYYSNAQKM